MILGMGWLPELIILMTFFVIPAGGILFVFATLGRRARRFGYPSRRAYLAAAPRTDAEKRDAADLVMRGVVFCGLGLIFPPFILIWLVPLFYGGRKLAYQSMGLGLVDDADQPDA